MEEDKELKKLVGKENPFKVPEGYFEQLTDKIMDRLPEKEMEEKVEVTLWDRVKPMLYMAAMFLGLIFGANLFINKIPHRKPHMDLTATDSSEDLSNSIVEPINHQLIMDDYTLYQYLTSADTGNNYFE